MDYSFKNHGIVRFNDSLFSGWRVAAKTACYIGESRFDWLGARAWASVRLFPSPNNRRLIEPPAWEWVGGDCGTQWEIRDGVVRVQVTVLPDRDSEPALPFAECGYRRFKAFWSNGFPSSAGWCRLQLHFHLDFGGDPPNPVWWHRSDFASAGLPSLGKRR